MDNIGCFHVLAITKTVAINIFVLVYLSIVVFLGFLSIQNTKKFKRQSSEWEKIITNSILTKDSSPKCKAAEATQYHKNKQLSQTMDGRPK